MASILSTLGDAAEVLGGRADSPVVLSCEHASERLPGRWKWPEADQRLAGTHWAYDLGAADLTRELADRLGAPAVLSRYSRLLCDPNRPEDSDTLFRADAEAAPVHLNTGISSEDRQQRLAGYHRPYHAALSSTLGVSLLSLHSFTPDYEGERRPMEIGVLWNREDTLGQALNEHLVAAGFLSEGNTPYSGKDGFMYAADRHAAWHGRRALELEVRQDLCTDPAFRKRLIEILARYVAQF